MFSIACGASGWITMVVGMVIFWGLVVAALALIFRGRGAGSR